MRKLWGRTNSSNVMKVLWLLGELELPYERIDATLEEDGFTLWESHAILRYLAAAHGAATLWPEPPRAHAAIDRWLDWTHTTAGPPMATGFQGMVRTAPEQRNMAAIEAALASAAQAWTLLDTQLQRHDYVAGPEFTLADIPSGVIVHRWFSPPLARPELPALRGWYDRLLARPAYREHCAAAMT